jgi:hypothetical protein
VSTVEQIERAIQSLSAGELAEFRAWFAAYDAEVWDREFDEDVQKGGLDRLADEALDAHDRGECTPL